MAKNKGTLSAIVHSRIGSHEVDSKAVTPEIIFHIMEGKDAEDIFRGRMSNYQKIAIGTLVVLAVSCLIALFLLKSDLCSLRYAPTSTKWYFSFLAILG